MTITSFGLPVAPVAVTWIVPVRTDVPVLALNAQVIVPVSVPLVPDVIESQVPPDVTAAVHGMVPVPVLETLNDVVPASFTTFWVAGDTDRTGCVFPVISAKAALPKDRNNTDMANINNFRTDRPFS